MRTLSTSIGRRARWLVAGLGLALLAAACGSGAAEATVIRYRFEPGETRTYDLAMQMDLQTTGTDEEAPAVEGTMTATMTMTVEEIQDDGTTVLEVEMTEIEFEVEGEDVQAPPIPESSTMTITIGPDGEVRSVEGSLGAFGIPGAASPFFSQTNPTDQSMPQFFFPRFPDDEIGPGDTWSETTETPLGVGDATIEVTVEGSHEGFEDTEFGRAAKIRESVEVPMEFEFAFGELLAGLAESFGQAPQATLPPGFDEAKMVMSGTTSGESTSLVIPENADAVSVAGTMTIDQQIRFENFPSFPGQDVPEEMTVTGTVDIQMRRVS